MNSRALGALVRREVFRGRRRLLVCLLAAKVGVVATVMLPGPIAVLPAMLSLGAGFFAMFGPLGDLRYDKVAGACGTVQKSGRQCLPFITITDADGSAIMGDGIGG